MRYCTMFWKSSGKISALILLLYYAGFAVSPISAIIPAETPEQEAQDIRERKGGRSDLFFYDLALWEILKKAKHSGDAAGIIQNSGKAADDLTSKQCDGAAVDRMVLTTVSSPIRFLSKRPASSYQTASLTYSGLSPPFLS